MSGGGDNHVMQPANFAFAAENKAEADRVIAKYPAGRQASAVLPLLYIAQKQEGWVPRAAMDFLCRGHMLADVSAILGSLDIVFGEVDR